MTQAPPSTSLVTTPAPLASTVAAPAPNRNSKIETRKSLLRSLALHLLLALLAIAVVLPFLWMLLASLKTPDEVFGDSWLPAKAQWTNYRDVFYNPQSNAGIPFGRFLWNSLFVASWVTFLQVLTSSMAAYGFARLEWKGRDQIFLLYLATMMVPGVVTMVANFSIMIQLHLIDTLPGLIIPAAFSAFGTFLLRQFMLSIPRSLDEAAEIDGASKWQIFWNVILPLARPGLITLTIFTFIGNYQSFFWPLIMLRDSNRYTLPVGLLYFDSTASNSAHLLMAAATMAVVPMIVLFVVMQKYLVKGIQLGAVKG